MSIGSIIEAPRTENLLARLAETGFVRKPHEGESHCFVNEGGMFPHILVGRDQRLRIGIKVGFVADFLAGNLGPLD